MMESKGPSINSGNLKEGKPVNLEEGQELLIVIDMNMEGDNTKIACSYKNLPDTVIIGSTICISLENDPNRWARLEVIEILDVSTTPSPKLKICLANRLALKPL